MGNKLAAQQGGDFHLHDLQGVAFEEIVGKGRFMKTLRCVHDEGLLLFLLLFLFVVVVCCCCLLLLLLLFVVSFFPLSFSFLRLIVFCFPNLPPFLPPVPSPFFPLPKNHKTTQQHKTTQNNFITTQPHTTTHQQAKSLSKSTSKDNPITSKNILKFSQI